MRLDAPQLVVVYPWNSVPGAGAGTLSLSTPGPVSGPAGAPLRLPGGERRRPPHLRLHLHKHYHSSPIKTTGILLTYSTQSSPIPLSNRTATAPGTPGASMAPAPCGTGNTRGKMDPARVCPHVHASHHARGPKGPGSTIRTRAQSHPMTASRPRDPTGQARPATPMARATPLPSPLTRTAADCPLPGPRTSRQRTVRPPTVLTRAAADSPRGPRPRASD